MPQTASQKASRSAAQPQPLTDAATETPDHEYALVSVLYHALQGAQACEQYIEDAEQAGDDELVKFFQECAQEQQRRATRAKQLLASNMDLDDEDDEDDEDEDDED
jgi:hypothetical protein